MTSELRPDPDALLAAIQDAEASANRGKLKIFLGMCAGVGKTYAMLRAAQQRKKEGLDVLVGAVETHGRVETEELLSGLLRIPYRQIDYRGVTISEMDIDAILERHPQLVLVDELAHTNAPSSRHPKRFQDVLEILDKGIDVYTTLNIQHIESRVDVLKSITNITVHETVPDSMLDAASEILLVDITPEQLLSRLKEGKVYLGSKAGVAAENFFREENLTALREIALRATAEHVGHDLVDVMASKQISGPWKTGERLLTAIGPSPFSEHLIRWTRRIAAAMDAQWIAVYVETSTRLGEEEKSRLAKNLNLARVLGAEIITVAGDRIAEAILKLSRERNVTQIVVGKPLGNQFLYLLKGGSLVDQLIRDSGDIDICVIRAEKKSYNKKDWRFPPSLSAFWTKEIFISALAVCGVTVGGWLLKPFFNGWIIANFYTMLIILLAVSFRRRTALFSAILSAVGWYYVFSPSYWFYTGQSQNEYFVICFFLLIAFVVGQLSAKLRLREMAERKKEKRARALYRLAQSVVNSTTLNDGLKLAVKEIDEIFASKTAVFLSRESGELEESPHLASTLKISEKERSVAVWSFLNNRPAGCFTDTLPEAQGFYTPLHTTKSKVGVLAVQLAERRVLGTDERELLDAFADQVAAIIERYWLIEQSSRTLLAEESEKLYKTLFDCVSHELKTPLAMITTIAGDLRQLLGDQNGQDAVLFLGEMEKAAKRLRRVVDNLLDMTRLESGHLQLDFSPFDVKDVIEAAQNQVADLLEPYTLEVKIQPYLPKIQADSRFMEHAIANLLANAAAYSYPGGKIGVQVKGERSAVIVSVIDEGLGFSQETESRMFEKFYRGPNAKPGGTGLGLSIVHGIMQALGGNVVAENNNGCGATFSLIIPSRLDSQFCKQKK